MKQKMRGICGSKGIFLNHEILHGYLISYSYLVLSRRMILYLYLEGSLQIKSLLLDTMWWFLTSLMENILGLWVTRGLLQTG